MLKVIETVGDALEPSTYKDEDSLFPIVMHQCNNYGVMGSGIAAQVAVKARAAHTNYQLEHEFFGLKEGNISFGLLNNGQGMVANCQTQQDGDSVVSHTVYEAILKCCNYISTMVQNSKVPLCIVIPKNYGCGIADGNWEQVRQIFINSFRNLNTILYIVEWSELANGTKS